MWKYEITSGSLFHDEQYEGRGYSGTGAGRDKPSFDHIKAVGPIPAGDWAIGPAHDHPHLGPCVMNLDPVGATFTYGRSAFRIHGDNARHDASEGCIVLGPSLRHLIAGSPDRCLKVVP